MLEGLCEKAVTRMVAVFGQMRSDDENRQVWSRLLDFTREPDPVEFARHPDVGQHQIERMARRHQSERFGSVCGFEDDIAFVAQHFGGNEADENLILDDENDGIVIKSWHRHLFAVGHCGSC